MNPIDQNINKDMIEDDLIDVDTLDLSEDQTCLIAIPEDSGNKLDTVDWSLSSDWPVNEDNDYLNTETELYALLDNIHKHEVSTLDKQKFDSRTYVRPKKRMSRPSVNAMEFGGSKLATIHQNVSANDSPNKYLTYNKYNNPSPMLRLKTFNVDTNTDNSTLVKDYALKRRSLVQDDESQLDDVDITLVSNTSARLSVDTTTKPINIDLSQPAHNLHNTFNKGMTNLMNERGSLTMYCSGDSLMRMSPPSLVSSMHMEGSGTFNPESLEGRQTLDVFKHKDSGVPSIGRESIDPMMTSMTLSIMDERDMNTSFLSQTTYPDNDSLMDSLPPSLVNSVNSSFLLPKSRTDSLTESNATNVFSSDTFTHLQKSEKLLKARPSLNMFNSITKRESGLRMSESYVKSREECVQVNVATKDSATQKISPEMGETVTLEYSDKLKKDAIEEKENLNTTFEKDNAFYRDMGMQKPTDLGKNSMNVTLDKQELNEIIQARQKLSLARKALPTEEKATSNSQSNKSPVRTIQLPNQTITVPKHSIENASELLSRRRVLNANGYDKEDNVTRDVPKRNATFKKPSPPKTSMDATVVFLKKDENIIDINSATMTLIDSGDRTLQQEEWCAQERAMVGSSESTDTGTFSSSSPPDSVPETHPHEPRGSISSTPLMAFKKGSVSDLHNLHNNISPIYDYNSKDFDHQPNKFERNSNDAIPTASTINTATMVKKSSAKRDILVEKSSPEKKLIPAFLPTAGSRISPPRISPGSTNLMAPPTSLAVPRRTALPTSKLRQYSSHRELNRIPGASSTPPRTPACARGGGMTRRGVYSSNPVLSPLSSVAPPIRRDSYTVLQSDEVIIPVARQSSAPTPALIRQGTETLRRDRPHSQLVAPRDLRARPGVLAVATGVPVPHPRSSHHIPAPTISRPTSIAGTGQLRVNRPASANTALQRPQVIITEPSRPVSGLPRPSRLPGPSVQRRVIRPPSVYSVAPTADLDHY